MVKEYMFALRISGFILAAVVGILMERSAKRTGRHELLRCTPAVLCTFYLFVEFLGYFIGYTFWGFLLVGTFFPPTCAAKMPWEGVDVVPCTIKRFAIWVFWYAIGRRGQDLGVFEQMWKHLSVLGGFALVPLLFLLATPLEETPPMSEHEIASRFDQEEILGAEKRERSIETNSNGAQEKLSTHAPAKLQTGDSRV